MKYQRPILFTFFVTLCLQRIESATPSLVSTNTITDPEIFKLSPSWISVLDCFREDSPTSCLQKRAFRAIEEAMPPLNTDQAENYVPQEKDEKDQSKDKLPDGVSPAVGRFIERLGDIIATGITHFYPDESAEIGENSTPQSIQAARGHKKKVKKAIKKAILKVIIFLLLLKQKIKMLLMAAQTFLQFKFLIVAIVYVLSNIVKIWIDIKHKHNPQKVIYYENAHHQHHYEPEHHHDSYDDHEHGGWGLWARSIVATEPTNTPASIYYDNNKPRSLTTAHDLAYSAQKTA